MLNALRLLLNDVQFELVVVKFRWSIVLFFSASHRVTPSGRNLCVVTNALNRCLSLVVFPFF